MELGWRTDTHRVTLWEGGCQYKNRAALTNLVFVSCDRWKMQGFILVCLEIRGLSRDIKENAEEPISKLLSNFFLKKDKEG
jgi:hypothetical protein